MKFTDKFIMFPIRVNKISFNKNGAPEESEEPNEDDPSVEISWVSGRARIPLDEIVGWYDSFSEDREVDEVAEKGFDICIVETKTMGEFMVNMKREKFEELLNKHSEKLEKLENEKNS